MSMETTLDLPVWMAIDLKDTEITLFSLFVIATLILIPLGIKDAKKMKIKKLQDENELKDLTLGFDEIIKHKLFVNENTNEIIINNNKYEFKKILSCELLEDGNTITTTVGKKKASIGKALVGGALFGGAGAIVGGNSGKINSKSTDTNYCTKLELKITINNLSNPCEYIKLISYRTKKDSNNYKKEYENAQNGLSLFQVITNINESIN